EDDNLFAPSTGPTQAATPQPPPALRRPGSHSRGRGNVRFARVTDLDSSGEEFNWEDTDLSDDGLQTTPTRRVLQLPLRDLCLELNLELDLELQPDELRFNLRQLLNVLSWRNELYVVQ
ncbi:hypothetical protein MPER_04804, partial [Moniliophthora perniciosa FA553]